MKTIEVNLYQFDELSEKEKEKCEYSKGFSDYLSQGGRDWD